MVLTKIEVLKMKAEIANLRRIALDLAPGTMKLALSKRAEDIGKKIRLYGEA